MFGSLFKFSSKMIATFILVIAIYLLSIVFFPKFLMTLQDAANWMGNALRTPGKLSEQQTVFWRTFVNEGAFMGIMMTLIARTIVELFVWSFTNLLGFGKKDDPAPAKLVHKDDGVGPAAGGYYN